MAFFNENSALRGACPAPFLQETNFPAEGGFMEGRLCFPVEIVNATCCLPCPVTDWTYSDGFKQRSEVGSWVNLAAVFATAFLLLSFIVLPVKWTHRHYLTICLVLAVFCIEIAFIVPLAAKPEQCFNEITPNGMSSDLTCAFSGAMLLFGGLAAVIWVFWRALSIHLQICWEVVPGPKFFYSALVLGWGIPAIGLATTLSLTGVSYRFGSICHINHDNGLQTFWGPLLAFAALAMVLQFITIGYCVQVYVRSLLNDNHSNSGNGSLPTYNGSISTASARQTYRRVKKVIQLQWRGATIVLLIIAEVIFFSVIFVSMDNGSQVNRELLVKATPWLRCLGLSGGDKNKCLPQAATFIKSEEIVLAVLVCLGMSGFWCLLLLGRWSMVLGWKDLCQRKILERREFVSADARRKSADLRAYEMLDSKRSDPKLNITASNTAFTPSTIGGISPVSPDAKLKDEYFGRQTLMDTSGSPPSRNTNPLAQHSPSTYLGWDQSTYLSPTSPPLPVAAFAKDYAR